jgi:hypothetical protein
VFQKLQSKGSKTQENIVVQKIVEEIQQRRLNNSCEILKILIFMVDARVHCE